MCTFRWLHFSDFHFGNDLSYKYWQEIKGRLFDDIRLLENGRNKIWDAIFLTGDLVNSGKQEEFNKFQKEFEELKNFLKKRGSDPVVFAVPGNHDLDRPNENNNEYINFKNALGNNDPRFFQDIWDKKENRYKHVIKEAFKSYQDWYKDHNSTRHPQISINPGLLPGDFLATIDNGIYKIGVIGLNSSFLQLERGLFENKLELNLAQISHVNPHIQTWRNSHDIYFVITHHPYNWLSENGKKQFDSFIAPGDEGSIHLFGHQHDNMIFSLKGGSGQSRNEIQVRSLFGAYNPNKNLRYGYHAGEIDFSCQNPFLMIQPRKIIKADTNAWKFVRDQKCCKGDSKETVKIRLKRLRPWQKVVQPAIHQPETDGNGEIYFDCNEENLINYLKKANEIVIVGITNENLNEYLMNAFEKREFRQWGSVTIVFLSWFLLNKINEMPDNLSTESLEEQWNSSVQLTRFTLRRITEKASIYVYDKYLPFIGQQFDNKHTRIAFILPNSESENRCYMNIIGNITPCKFFTGKGIKCKNFNLRPSLKKIANSERQCLNCDFWHNKFTPCLNIKESFEHILNSSKSVLTSSLSGFMKKRNGDEQFYFKRLLPLVKWTEIQFQNAPDKDHKIPVFPVVLILFTYKGKIILQKRTQQNAGSVCDKYGLISGKLQDEDFLNDTKNDPTFDDQHSKMYESYSKYLESDGLRSKKYFQKFYKEMRKLSSIFINKFNINTSEPISQDKYSEAWNRAVKRTVCERLGVSINAFHLFNSKNYSIKQYLTIRHSDGGCHKVFINLYTCEFNEDTLDDLGEGKFVNIEQYSSEEFKNLYDHRRDELTPFIIENFESLYEYFTKYQNKV